MEGVLSLFNRVQQYSDAIIVVLIIVIIGSMVLPVPAFLLDILLTSSITFSLIILMTTVYVKKSLEITAFPSLLLIATLFRLSLNVASTRRILLHGHEGPDVAGHVIQSFGQFVVGGSYVVGIVVFAILVVINYIVITKGTERISEVAARFTLDAMPGKQMSIDADLNSGLIDEKEAQRRREEIRKEADFYGAMDGASKFIRGDAVAGIIITLVNMIGGIIIGVVQRGMDFQTALQNFTILTIGDGLVSQIPALITSTAAGLMVTRAASETNLGKEIFTQLTSYPKALWMASGAIFIMGIIPGMPFLPFSILSGIVALTGYLTYLTIKEKEKKEKEERAKEILKEATKEEPPEEIITQPDVIAFEVGYGLIPYLEEEQNGELLKRIKSLRRQLTRDLGIPIPLIHIRDNLTLKPGEYRILIKGIEVARGEVIPGKYLAIDTGNVREKIDGIPTKDPTFGLNAYWIDESLKDKAKIAGYTVVDIPTVIITHLSETLKQNLSEILTRAIVKDMIDNLAKKYPIVKDIVPEQVPLNVIHRVLQNLLKEKIPINDILSILETLSDYIRKTEDIDLLTEFVRQYLQKRITSIYAKNGSLDAIVLSAKVEDYINQKLRENNWQMPSFDPVFIQNLISKITPYMEQFLIKGEEPVLLTSPAVRRFVKKLIELYIPNLNVLSYSEIDPKVKLNIIGMVDLNGN
ncbi:flagellar biosynthesis protein FlhA [Venenivibrio stagnispumantis]|uniref:Flagellar biosynthesis protein FlhA n=1 Tax=Venenivibrio stagnispumantis TaxID=407998 RepID=A0AA45WMD2_9AQUI|nr:flagellar biosynthesis protein FlhA [Venenivibrio stagnispumantis]MCW4572809.1 flagellar biosynthesis protein FlhA [Venenivibrio stagnispumantis]SMP13721.1 flagellar biosynthesis protein FlhA [Venenivibrio stagnispumantis]